jgi:hypothetical protein
VLDRFAGVGGFGADEGTGEDDRRAGFPTILLQLQHSASMHACRKFEARPALQPAIA